jgi:hypothetical protein
MAGFGSYSVADAVHRLCSTTQQQSIRAHFGDASTSALACQLLAFPKQLVRYQA